MGHFVLLHASDLHLAQTPRQMSCVDLGSRLRRRWNGGWGTARRSVSGGAGEGRYSWMSSYDPWVWEGFVRFARSKANEIDCIVITGDFATTAGLADLRAAQSLFNIERRYCRRRHNGRTVVVCLPGNHDRFDPAAGFGPRHGRFERVFQGLWPVGATGVRASLLAKAGNEGERLGIVAADCTLRSWRDAAWPPWGVWGQGRVYPDVVEKICRESDRVREMGAGGVVWACHFPPACEGIAAELRLIAGERLVAAAKNAGVDVILAGHVHGPRLYTTNGVLIACAGTASQYYAPERNHVQTVDIRIGDENGIAVQDYFWDDEIFDFVASNWDRGAVANA